MPRLVPIHAWTRRAVVGAVAAVFLAGIAGLAPGRALADDATPPAGSSSIAGVDSSAGTSGSLTFQPFLLAPAIVVETPRPAITGELFTFRLAYPADVTLGPKAVCQWELRWGSTASLRDFDPDETYGGLVFSGPASKGYCTEWTFTLPWVPVRQYALDVSIADDERGFHANVTIGGDGTPFLTATVGSTDRHIRSSNLPIVYMLPDRYTIVVGEPVTYRIYPRGGATLTDQSPWTAYLAGTARGFTKRGGSSFTFVPFAAGDWLVGWNRYPTTYPLGAYYDPPARLADRSAPVTTRPVQRIASATVPFDPSVPVDISWSGSDRGWGIAKYQLQRRRDGGAWTTVALPTPRTTAIRQALAAGATWEYRVRAVDRAGNVGAWQTGPAFRPRRVGDTSSVIVYRGAWSVTDDATALGGRYRAAATAGASATFAFTGRDVAWIAPRGPGMGRAEVWVDGALRRVVDLEAAAPAPRSVVFRAHWGARGDHLVRIRVLGTPGRPSVGVDGFVVLR